MHNSVIYVSNWRSDLDFPLPAGQEWMWVGPAADTAPKNGINDIMSDGTRLPNHIWSELSGIYKLWKEGPRASTIGFNQYRRFMNWSAREWEADQEIGADKFPYLRNTLMPGRPSDWAGPNLLTVPKPVHLEICVRDQYAKWYPVGDYDGAVEQAVKRFPYLAPAFEQHLYDCTLYSCNMFFATWEMFDEICTIWFDTLLNFYPRSQRVYDTPYAERAMGFVAERITDAWIRSLYLRNVEIRTVPRWMLK